MKKRNEFLWVLKVVSRMELNSLFKGGGFGKKFFVLFWFVYMVWLLFNLLHSNNLDSVLGGGEVPLSVFVVVEGIFFGWLGINFFSSRALLEGKTGKNVRRLSFYEFARYLPVSPVRVGEGVVLLVLFPPLFFVFYLLPVLFFARVFGAIGLLYGLAADLFMFVLTASAGAYFGFSFGDRLWAKFLFGFLSVYGVLIYMAGFIAEEGKLLQRFWEWTGIKFPPLPITRTLVEGFVHHDTGLVLELLVVSALLSLFFFRAASRSFGEKVMKKEVERKEMRGLPALARFFKRLPVPHHFKLLLLSYASSPSQSRLLVVMAIYAVIILVSSVGLVLKGLHGGKWSTVLVGGLLLAYFPVITAVAVVNVASAVGKGAHLLFTLPVSYRTFRIDMLGLGLLASHAYVSLPLSLVLGFLNPPKTLLIPLLVFGATFFVVPVSLFFSLMLAVPVETAQGEGRSLQEAGVMLFNYFLIMAVAVASGVAGGLVAASLSDSLGPVVSVGAVAVVESVLLDAGAFYLYARGFDWFRDRFVNSVVNSG